MGWWFQLVKDTTPPPGLNVGGNPARLTKNVDEYLMVPACAVPATPRANKPIDKTEANFLIFYTFSNEGSFDRLDR